MVRRKSKVQKSGSHVSTHEKPEPERSDRPKRLRPSLQLSELVNNDQVSNTLSAHQKVAARLKLPNLEAIAKQATLAAEFADNDQMRNALSAYQRVTDQLRAVNQQSNLDTIAKQAAAAAALLTKNFSGVTSARDLARTAAAMNPALIQCRPEASAPLAEQIQLRAVLKIKSAHDLGQLVRKEREKRKLSQQAFADLAGVGRRFISELENGKATLEFDKALQVASAIGIDLLARPRQ